jgi:arsenate reductase (thioredoxin)
MDKKKVLFVCVHNSGRSQIAEATFNQFAAGKATATSAGSKPASHVNPTVVIVMRELGLDLSQNQPKLLTMRMIENASRVITMGCGVEETCPASIVPMENWGIEDPAGKSLEKVREIRDIISEKVKKLITELYPETQLEIKGGEK